MLIDSGILGGGAQLRCESGLLGGGAILFLHYTDSGLCGGIANLRSDAGLRGRTGLRGGCAGLLGGGAIPFLQKIDSDLRSDEGLHGFANISSEGTILIHQCSVVGLSIVSTGLSGVVVLHRDGYSDDLCPALIG